MQKTFILGVGSQKGGTSWLHKQLANNPSIDFGFRKEYHVFDAINTDQDLSNPDDSKQFGKNYRDNVIQTVLRAAKDGNLGINEARNRGSRRRALQLAFLDNINYYFDYFDYQYLKNPEVQAVGDITPSYALLKPKTFQLIKRGLIKRGFTVKVFFLMRDPVERAWSMARMKKRDMNAKKQKKFDEFKYLYNLKDNRNERKSRYEYTIQNLEKVFNEDDIYYDFYERLFTPESRTRLQQFLKLELQEFDSNQIVNASPKSETIPEELNQHLVNHFRSTYAFMLGRHGDMITNLWQGYQHFKT